MDCKNSGSLILEIKDVTNWSILVRSDKEIVGLDNKSLVKYPVNKLKTNLSSASGESELRIVAEKSSK